MKKIFGLILFFFTISLIAQDRTNRPKNKFASKSEILQFATGWMYNDLSGEWIDNKNYIDLDTLYKNTTMSTYLMSRSVSSFVKLQFCKLETPIKGAAYILKISYVDGNYEYPNIKEGWDVFDSVKGFGFTKEQFSDLKLNATLKSYKPIISYECREENYDENTFIQGLINCEYYFPFETEILQVKYIKDDTVRFLLPNYTTKDFKNNYFECSRTDWDKLFK